MGDMIKSVMGTQGEVNHEGWYQSSSMDRETA